MPVSHALAYNWDQRWSNKAVADGAILYILDHSVTSRISKYTYGIECAKTYDSKNPEHVARQHMQFTKPSGKISISGIFKVILDKVIMFSVWAHPYLYVAD